MEINSFKVMSLGEINAETVIIEYWDILISPRNRNYGDYRTYSVSTNHGDSFVRKI